MSCLLSLFTPVITVDLENGVRHLEEKLDLKIHSSYYLCLAYEDSYYTASGLKV